MKCPECNGEVEQNRNNSKKFCSKKCYNRNYMRKYLKNPENRGKMNERNAAQCRKRWLEDPKYRKKSVEYNKKWRKENPEKIRELKLKYIKSDKGKETLKKYQQSDKYKEYRKKYFKSKSFKESQRKYKQSDRGKKMMKIAMKKYSQTDSFKNSQKKYHKKNRDKILKYQKERYQKNKEARKS
ncbi:hypothetical protein HQ529_03650 [Candidatus Woesearchaeota archaeon]|nr:hypothetical protein [Candidatus Woesearchaeota archaeon]